MKDVTTHAAVYDRQGRLENEIALPGPGTAAGFGGQKEDTSVFYVFSAFNTPPTIYRYDIPTHKTTLFRAPEIPGFRSADYESKEVFYRSRDGTRIPMFVTYKKGLKREPGIRRCSTAPATTRRSSVTCCATLRCTTSGRAGNILRSW